MTLPSGYTPQGKKSSKAKVIGIIVVVAIIVGIIAGIASIINHDNAVIEEAFDYGCKPTSWSFSGKPTSWECPLGTPEHVGRY